MMSRKSTMIHQMSSSLKEQCKFGVSKHAEKNGGNRVKGLFSYETHRTYYKNGITFINWVLEKHTKVKNLNQAKEYVAEHLHELIALGRTPFTVHTRAFALASIYQCDVNDFGVELPKRLSKDFMRTRNAPDISEFKEETRYIHKFAEYTGARRGGLERLTTDCLSRDSDGRLLIRLHEKGGKIRLARVAGGKVGEKYVTDVIEKAKERNSMRGDGCKKVFPDNMIPEYEPLHQHRRTYAKTLYKEVIKSGEHKIADRGLYRCRRERYGEVYDRTALAIVSYNLGHGQPHELPHEVERVGVVVTNYLR